MNVGRTYAVFATIQGVQFINARNFRIFYFFVGKIEAQTLVNLPLCQFNGAFIQLISKDKNGVTMITNIFLNDATNVGINIVI